MRTDHRRFVVSLGMVLAVGGGSFARAQSPADPSGHWEGSVQIPGNSIPFVVDLAKDAKGQLIGTVTNTDVKGLPLTKIALSGRSLLLQANADQPFNGELSDDGRTISGTVTLSGYSLPLALTRTGDAHIEPPPTSAAVSKELEGAWEGTLQASRGPMHLVLTVTNRPDGRATAQFVSVDEGGLLIPVVITQNGSNVSYTSTVVASSWAGVLSADGRELTGTFTQGPASLPLTFRRAGSGK
jgi:hypothetical protein